MKTNKQKLKEKLEMASFTKLSKKLEMSRGNLYYHFNNLKKGELTFPIEVIKKISIVISGQDDIFFE